jgi:hypothetical protein
LFTKQIKSYKWVQKLPASLIFSFPCLLRDSTAGVQLMLEEEDTMAVPSEQQMERNETLQKEHVEEHRAALRRAVTLSVPDARGPSPYGTFDEVEQHHHQPERSESFPPAGPRQRMSWNDLIERVFDKDEDGHIVLRSSVLL